MENAIKHGLKNIEKGIIKVKYEIIDNFMKITVSDNGKGFKDQKDHILDHKSVGMKITKRRLEILSDHKNENELVKIIERKNSKGDVNGADAVIQVKI